jgi:hypothetical protein
MQNWRIDKIWVQNLQTVITLSPNVVCGQVGHAGMWATPLKYREKRDALLNYYLNGCTTTTKSSFLRG